ncbi:hypothetical protein ACFQ1F_09440 [Flaviramulus multivorans]|nr:hypothetical protein [Flaviramulus multivorans]
MKPQSSLACVNRQKLWWWKALKATLAKARVETRAMLIANLTRKRRGS